MTLGVIYVSSNQEDPAFEAKTRADLLSKVGDLPIVSVTQKPVLLGNNICVGEVGASGFNFCRQVLIALENIDTDFVLSAESDCLYSPDYFLFTPERLDIPYRNTNIYVQKYGQDYFCKKSMSTFSQIVGRKFYMERLKELFVDQLQWSMELKNFPKEIKKNLFDKFETFETKFPCLSFKTGRGMRKHSNSDDVPIYELPYWGQAKDLVCKYLKD
jgi:hypothetical protein